MRLPNSRLICPCILPATMILISLAMPQPSRGQTTELSLQTIMRHPEWLGRAPQRPYWSWDSQSVYFYRSQPTVDEIDPRLRELNHQFLSGDAALVVSPQSLGEIETARAVRDHTNQNLAYERDGDLFVRSLVTGDLRQLTRTTDRESRPFFLADGRLGFYRGSNAVYARDLATGFEEQLFALQEKEAPEDKAKKKRAERDYVAREEERLIEWIQAGETRSKLGRAYQKERSKDPSSADLPWYLGDKTSAIDISPSPNARLALVTVSKKSSRPEGTKMPTYLAASANIEIRDVRTKVGTTSRSNQRLVVLDRSTRKRVEIDLDNLPTRRDDPLAELREAAEAREKERKMSETEEPASTPADAPNKVAEQGDPGTDATESSEPDKKKARPVSLGPVLWSPNGDFAVVQAISNDHKDRWLFHLSWPNLSSTASKDSDEPGIEPTLRVLHHQHDPAWINWSFRDVGLVPGSDLVYFLSEESGWSHLYLVDGLTTSSKASENATQITSGKYVVDAPVASLDGSAIFFTSSELHPGRTEIYRLDLESRKIRQITDLGGQNSFQLAPDGSQLLITHSTTTDPPELYVQDLEKRAEPSRLTHTVSEEFLAHNWVAPSIVEVPSSHHDRAIYSRLYLPTAESSGSSNTPSGRPAVLFVHGAGYLQNSHMGWSGYFREFMFHTLLTRRGYVVLDMDYRASKGYGRDWRTAIYRQMGWPEVEDLEDGVQYLVKEHNVDPARIGVYGGSYGGFLTFMAMFNKPDLFAAGAALRPVTDWAHYNHEYTSNILNTPELDPEAYQKSSPIEFAAGLSKPLLIATGVLDDNVFFQDSVRLVQRLIELEKENWEIAIYPVEPHGFREPTSWLDEYRRILALFEQHLRPIRH